MSTASFPYDLPTNGSLPASRLCGMRFTEKDRAIAQGVVQSQGQDKWARRRRPFGLATRARRVRLRGQQPKQSNATTRRLAIMNLAIRGIEATAMRDSALQPREAIPQSASEARDNFGPEHADAFRRDLHPDLRADYVLATAKRDSAFSNAKPYRRACRRQDNPMPFNDSDTALRGSAFLQSEAKPQVVSEAKDNIAGVDFVCLRFASAVLANGSMSSNQSGDCPARSATSKPKAKPQSLPRQCDIRRALIEADLVDTALRDSAFLQREATPQVLSKAKNNMVALPGQLFYSTQIPVCLWFGGKNNTLDSANVIRLFDGETELSLVA